MDKRSFIKLSGMVTAGALITPSLTFCTNGEKQVDQNNKPAFEKFILPTLPYGYDALEPHIDAQTMEIHHGKHHASYTSKLNAALEGRDSFYGMQIEDVLDRLTADDDLVAIRNNGGGYYNHSLYFETMDPSGGGVPGGILGEAINARYGNFESFKDEFSNEAKGVFGSGWAWLILDKNRQLQISSTPNQDSPLMKNIVETPGTPILGIDVWEHAYYLKHQNKRSDYIDAFFSVINWDKVAARFSSATK